MFIEILSYFDLSHRSQIKKNPPQKWIRLKSTVQRGRALLISRSKSQMKLLSAHPSGTIWRPGCSPHASLRACVFQQWGVSQSIRRRRSVLMAHSAAWQKDVLFEAKWWKLTCSPPSVSLHWFYGSCLSGCILPPLPSSPTPLFIFPAFPPLSATFMSPIYISVREFAQLKMQHF